MYSKSENVTLERVANWLHLASPLLCATYIYGLALALKNFRECYVAISWNLNPSTFPIALER